MNDSIQPDNRSALQVAIEQTLDQMIGVVDDKAPLPELFDGMNTPPQFLPPLAIERGVTDWYASDEEKGKRATVKNALPIQSMACSKYGLELSVESLGLYSSIERLSPYVLHITSELNGGNLTEELLNRIIRRVNTYKRARDSVSVSMANSDISSPSISMTSESGVVSDSQPYKKEQFDYFWSTAIGIATETCIISDCEAAQWKKITEVM